MNSCKKKKKRLIRKEEEIKSEWKYIHEKNHNFQKYADFK